MIIFHYSRRSISLLRSSKHIICRFLPA